MVPPSATVLYAMRGRQDVVAASSRKHVQGPGRTREDRRLREPGPRYKWVALTNTTMGVLMVVINGSITIIALPAIFRGIRLNPLAPGNSSYFLWVLMGFLLITSVLVLTFGRLGDMYGRVRMYNLGFAIFTVFSILLSVNWMTGHRRSALDHPHASRPGHRWVARVRQLERHPDRRLPGGSARAWLSGSTAWPPSPARLSDWCWAGCWRPSTGAWCS